MDNITNDAMHSISVSREELEVLQYIRNIKPIIDKSSGYGRIELKYQNDNGRGARLGTKSYTVTERVPGKPRSDRYNQHSQ